MAGAVTCCAGRATGHGRGRYDGPLALAGRCSAPRRSLRQGSPKVLPKPHSVLGGVMVVVQTRAALEASMPADGQALGDRSPHNNDAKQAPSPVPAQAWAVVDT